MSDVYTEFLDALHEVQQTSGLGAIRLGRFLGVSRDMMKSLLTGRRPGVRTIMSVVEGCEAGLRGVHYAALRDAIQRLRDASGQLFGMLTGCVEPAASGPAVGERPPVR